MCVHVLWLRISSVLGWKHAESRRGVVIASLPVNRAGDSSGFQVAFSFE